MPAIPHFSFLCHPMLIAKNKQPFLLFVLMALSVGSIAVSIALNIFQHDLQHLNEPLHSAFEAFGGMAAISMALLLLQLHQDGLREKGEYYLLSLGFFMLGILDTCHAVANIGHGFILLRSLASFFSSIWFAMVWLPGMYKYIVQSKSIPWLIAFMSLAAGISILTHREFFPMMMKDGHFTPLAIAINLVSGVLILSSALYFFREFLRSSSSESYFFTCMLLLLSLSTLGFPISVVWSSDWWFWHILRCLAFIVVFYYMFRTFLKVREALKKSNELLEQRIAERTAALTSEIAERVRYGKERDNVVTELQEALDQIKALTGLLPTCASCKKIRDTEGNWVQMETYIQNHSTARFTHGICPVCAKQLYPDVYDKLF
ncbi:MAG: hypothetical protein ACD_75C02615G0002 [uncultured bacterium]|nr:MAG: hypothetical protein ACD_75C02615G0002 [uncultured bacterium]